jgi:hypothetical protein
MYNPGTRQNPTRTGSHGKSKATAAPVSLCPRTQKHNKNLQTFAKAPPTLFVCRKK